MWAENTCMPDKYDTNCVCYTLESKQITDTFFVFENTDDIFILMRINSTEPALEYGNDTFKSNKMCLNTSIKTQR